MSGNYRRRWQGLIGYLSTLGPDRRASLTY